MVRILGCRGSVPVSGPDYARYGGATSCVLVRLAGKTLLLDAGTGLLSLPSVLPSAVRELHLLLSHPHADHLLGLPMCPALLQPGYRIHLWAAARGGLDPKAQVQALMGPPLWPVTADKLPSQLICHTITGSFSLGQLRVDCMEGDHPGGSTLFRLTAGTASVVYIPDCTLTGDTLARAAEFARDCSLLICDGQYSPEEWALCSHFGHSTWEMAAELGRLSRARQTRIFHHDPSHHDDMLSSAALALAEEYPNCGFAYEGEEIPL